LQPVGNAITHRFAFLAVELPLSGAGSPQIRSRPACAHQPLCRMTIGAEQQMPDLVCQRLAQQLGDANRCALRHRQDAIREHGGQGAAAGGEVHERKTKRAHVPPVRRRSD